MESRSIREQPRLVTEKVQHRMDRCSVSHPLPLKHLLPSTARDSTPGTKDRGFDPVQQPLTPNTTSLAKQEVQEVAFEISRFRTYLGHFGRSPKCENGTLTLMVFSGGELLSQVAQCTPLMGVYLCMCYPPTCSVIAL